MLLQTYKRLINRINGFFLTIKSELLFNLLQTLMYLTQSMSKDPSIPQGICTQQRQQLMSQSKCFWFQRGAGKVWCCCCEKMSWVCMYGCIHSSVIYVRQTRNCHRLCCCYGNHSRNTRQPTTRYDNKHIHAHFPHQKLLLSSMFGASCSRSHTVVAQSPSIDIDVDTHILQIWLGSIIIGV